MRSLIRRLAFDNNAVQTHSTIHVNSLKVASLPRMIKWMHVACSRSLRTASVRLSSYVRSVKSTYATVSQEISSPGNIVAATKFPRIYGRPSITERPYFLGNIAASSIFCRSQVHANDHRLSFWDGSKYNILLTCPPWRFQKNGNDYFRRKSKSFLVNIEIGKTTAGNRSTGVTDKYLNNSQLVWYCSQCKP